MYEFLHRDCHIYEGHMKTLILSPFPHFFHPSPPSLFISTITFTFSPSSPPHLHHLSTSLTPLIPSPSPPSVPPSSPHPSPPSPPPPSPPHPSPPSQSGVTKEHAAADGQRGHASTRLVPSPWLREELGQAAAGETAVHSKKGKTSTKMTSLSVSSV